MTITSRFRQRGSRPRPAARRAPRRGLDAEPRRRGRDRGAGRTSEGADRSSRRSSHVVISVGAPFVPIKHEGVIYIRPPVELASKQDMLGTWFRPCRFCPRPNGQLRC